MSKGRRLVYWYKPSCHFCQTMTPVLSRFAASRHLSVMKVNIDEHDPLAAEYNINYVPTVMLLVDGREVNRSQPTSRADLERLMILEGA